MSTAHAPEGLNTPAVPPEGTDTAVKTAENALKADDSQKLDVADLAKVEDPTVGDADESKELHDENEVKHDVVESGAGSFKVPEPDAEMQQQIIAAQEAINKLQAESPKPPQGNIEDLLGNLKAAPPQEHAEERPPRHFPLDRRNRDERRGKNRNENRREQDPVVMPAVEVVVLPAVEPPKPVAATQSTPKAPPVQVQNVVTPVPSPEDTEVANLRAQAQSNRNSVRPPWSPETNRRIGYGVMAFLAVLLTVWGLSHLLGDSKKTEVPQVPVDTVARVTPPAPTAANQVLLDKLQQMDNRLAEALPSQADLAILDDKITEAENAAVTEIAHVPCFKDPNQKRCTDAVKAERVYYDSDFSHPRDVALGKIPYTKTVEKPAPKKAGKKTKVK